MLSTGRKALWTREEKVPGVRAQLEALEDESQAEEARWEKERTRLQAALRRALG
jgi:hypothetical protein